MSNHSSRLLRVTGAIVASMFVVSAASAAPIGIGAFGPGDTLIDFDGLNGGGLGLTNGDIVTNQFAALGVTIANSFGNSHADDGIGLAASTNSNPNVLWSDQGGGGAGTGHYVDLIFGIPVSKVGMGFFLSVNASFTLEIYGAGNSLLETLMLNGVNQGVFDEGFAGLSSNTNIEFARISSLNGAGTASFNFSIDDLRFDGSPNGTVPEPGTLALLVAGLAGLRLRRRGAR